MDIFLPEFLIWLSNAVVSTRVYRTAKTVSNLGPGKMIFFCILKLDVYSFGQFNRKEIRSNKIIKHLFFS